MLKELLRRYVGPKPYIVTVGGGSDLDKWLLHEVQYGARGIVPRWFMVLEHFDHIDIGKRDWWYGDFMRLLRKLGEDHKGDDYA